MEIQSFLNRDGVEHCPSHAVAIDEKSDGGHFVPWYYVPVINSPGGMKTSSIFTPPAKSTVSFFGSLNAAPTTVAHWPLRLKRLEKLLEDLDFGTQ